MVGVENAQAAAGTAIDWRTNTTVLDGRWRRKFRRVERNKRCQDDYACDSAAQKQ
jgi:hypothetical protein